MNDKEAIDMLIGIMNFAPLGEKDIKAIETVLNLIEEYQCKLVKEQLEKSSLKAEIERLKNIISNTSAQFINDTIKTDKKNKEDIEALNEGWKIELEKKDREIEQLKSMELKAKGGVVSITLEGLINLENEIKKKDKEIQFQKDINKIEKDRHKKTEKSLKGQIIKQNKIIDLMEDEINKILKDGFERFGLDVYLEKENITVREFIERKLNSSEQIKEE